MTRVLDNRIILTTLLKSANISFGCQTLEKSVGNLSLEKIDSALKSLVNTFIQDEKLKNLINKAEFGLDEQEYALFQKQFNMLSISMSPHPYY